MRLELTLQHPPNQALPINYQYLIASWIYRILGNADADFAKQLHNHGYDFGGKKYKLFSFSTLRPKWFDIDHQRSIFRLTKSPTKITLSFYVDEAVQHFVMGLFKDQIFELSSGRFSANFNVSGIEMLPKPNFEKTMRFRTQTPICVSRNVDGLPHAHYASPDEEGYGTLLVQNLVRKRHALEPQIAGATERSAELDFPYEFKLLSKPKSKLLSIKGIQMRGYLFDFELMVPEDLMELGYFGGMGEKNSSLGMGMVKVLE